MSGSHTAHLFFLFQGLAELFTADIITDYAGRKRQASSKIYSLRFATEIMMRPQVYFMQIKYTYFIYIQG